MALFIDTKHLTEVVLPEQEAYLNSIAGVRGRFQLQRVTVFALVYGHQKLDPKTWLHFNCDSSCEKSFLDSQGNEKDSMEVLHELKQFATRKTCFFPPDIPGQRATSGLPKEGTTVLVANAQSPSFTAPTEEDPPSPYHRFSLITGTDFFSGYRFDPLYTDLQSVIPNCPAGVREWNRIIDVKIGSSTIDVPRREATHTLYYVRLDFVDHSSPASYSPSRRGRRTLNPFHHVSWRHEEPATKRFKGVRYRPEHKKLYAEMTPPGRSKVYLGSFDTEAEAARVVDVAFHHYGKELNFPDSTPRILSKRPRSEGLGDEERLRLVKEQVKWVKRRLPSMVSMPAAAGQEAVSGQNLFEIPSTVDTASLLSFSAIGPSSVIGSSDLADDGISQARPRMEATELNFSGDEMLWSADNAFAEPRILPEHARPGGTLVDMPGRSSAVEHPLGIESMPSMSPPFRVWTPPDQPDHQDIDALELSSAWFTFCAGV